MLAKQKKLMDESILQLNAQHIEKYQQVKRESDERH
jgi:hypothetical protein